MSRIHPRLRQPRTLSFAIALLLSLIVSFGAIGPVQALFAEPSADLTGDQEVPPTGSIATGSIDVTVDTDEAEPGSQFCYGMVVEDLSAPATAAHIHLGAPGTAAPNNIVLTLAVDDTGSAEQACAADADFNLANAGAATAVALMEDIGTNPQNYYVNVHTAAFPDGEIRGQLATEAGDEPEPANAVEPAPGIPVIPAAVGTPDPVTGRMPATAVEPPAPQTSLTSVILMLIALALAGLGALAVTARRHG